MIDMFLELSGITQAVVTWLVVAIIFAWFLCSHFRAEKKSKEDCEKVGK